MSGYDPHVFTDVNLPLPKLPAAQKKLRAPLVGKPRSFQLDYTHFSVVVNKERRFAFFTASNIDGRTWNALMVQQPYTKEEPMEVIFKRVEISVRVEAFAAMPLHEKPLHFTFDGITL